MAAVMAVGVTTALADPAFADVTVTVTVSKDKTITVDESITKEKQFEAIIDVDVTGDGAAEAQALANVLNGGIEQGNSVDLDGVFYQAFIGLTGVPVFGSINDNTGITQVSQAAGNMQNQGNLVAVGLTATGDAFVNAQTEVEQRNLNDETTQSSVVNSSFIAGISDSISDNTGVTQVNQDAGNMNNQTNAVAVAAGIQSGLTDALVALAEAALGQESSNHVVNHSNNIKTAIIGPGSISGNSGITHVNQSVGMYANQANVVSVAAAVLAF
jgi:hypothetical protein